MAVQSKHSDTPTSTCDRGLNNFYHGQKLELWGEEYTYDYKLQKWRNRFGGLENLRYLAPVNKRGELMAKVRAVGLLADRRHHAPALRAAVKEETRVGRIEHQLRKNGARGVVTAEALAALV
jgi:hypothetical protein